MVINSKSISDAEMKAYCQNKRREAERNKMLASLNRQVNFKRKLYSVLKSIESWIGRI